MCVCVLSSSRIVWLMCKRHSFEDTVSLFIYLFLFLILPFNMNTIVLLYYSFIHRHAVSWAGVGWVCLTCCVTAPPLQSNPTLPDWDYNTPQIWTLLSTLKAAFWRCTLERVKEIWKEGPALCLEGLHLSSCPQGSLCVCACACLGICLGISCT